MSVYQWAVRPVTEAAIPARAEARQQIPAVVFVAPSQTIETAPLQIALQAHVNSHPKLQRQITGLPSAAGNRHRASGPESISLARRQRWLRDQAARHPLRPVAIKCLQRSTSKQRGRRAPFAHGVTASRPASRIAVDPLLRSPDGAIGEIAA